MDADDVLVQFGPAGLDPSGGRAELPATAEAGLAGLTALGAAVAAASDRQARILLVAEYLGDEESMLTATAAWDVCRTRAEAAIMRLGAVVGMGKEAARLRGLLSDRTAPIRAVMTGERVALSVAVDHELPKALEIPDPWTVDASGLWQQKQKDGERIAVKITHRPIVPTGVLRDVDTSLEHVRLEWRRRDCSAWDSAVLPAARIQDTRSLVQATASVGAPVGQHNAAAIARYVHDAVDRSGGLPLAESTSRCGWLPARKSFLWGATLIGERGHIPAGCPPTEWGDGHAILLCDGEDARIADAFRAGGSAEAWADAMVRYVLPYPAAALGLYAALACPMLGVYAARENPIIDWSYQTSTGKTTILQVAASAWGVPTPRAGLITSWEATSARRERLCAQLQYLPLLLDDTKRALSEDDIEREVYRYAQGLGKGRAKLDGSRPTLRWAGAMLSTGEAPLMSYGTSGGSRARALCITGRPFGDAIAADNAALQAALTEHHGHAGPVVVRWLLDHRSSWDTIRSRYEASCERWRSVGSSEVGGRLGATAAFLESGERCAHDLVGLPRPAVSALESIPGWIAVSAGEADRATLALSDAYGWAVQHASEWWGREARDSAGPRQPARGWAGAWSATAWETIDWHPKCLRRVLSHLGHHPEEVISAWHERGWLVCDSGRHTKRAKVGAERLRCVSVSRAAIEAVIR